MDIRKVKKLIEMLEESDLGEIEIREGETANVQETRQLGAGGAKWHCRHHAYLS